MNTVTLPLALLFACGWALPVVAGQAYEAIDAGDVFVATVVRVEDREATNARPPQVWLEVHEVLRGETKIARSPAVWSPPFHGIDWGDGNQPAIKRWNAAPLKGPKVGQKFILGGKVLQREAQDPKAGEAEPPVYKLFSFVHIPYSAEARATVIAQLKALDERRRKYAAEQAAAAQELARRRQEWRAALTDKIIDERTQQADAVGIGTMVGDNTFEIETLFKGQPRRSNSGKYYVTLPADGYDRRIVDLLHDRPRSILFLSERNLIASVSDIQAQLVDPYEGLVLADEAAIAAVKSSLQKRPAPPPRPLLVISALERTDAAPLAEAARESFAVVVSHQFSGHGPNTIPHLRKTIPQAALLITIDGAPNRRVAATQIDADTTTLLHEANYPQVDAREHFRALVKKLGEVVR